MFLHHFPPPDASWPVALAAEQGHVGVTVFFVLSGFLITMRYSDALGMPGGVALGDYFRRRVARILPLYWTVLAVTLAVSTGGLRFSWAVLPEWLLLQGFLSRSVDALAVPTSWTLTLEETFYVGAPLLFVGLRRARAFGAARLLACTAALLAAGLVLGRLVDPERFQLLGSLEELLRHTIFGRFVDFALGVWGGRLFLSGRVTRWWARPQGHLAAAAAGAAGIALVFAGQAGMTIAGGLDGARWSIAWPFNLVVGVGSLVLILGLTDPSSPLSRTLGLAPFVYLGRVSYALYLIQLTPLGKGLLYRLIPPGTPWYGLLLYAGMTLVSALLYEVVEEPGRRLVLRIWPNRHHGAPHREDPREERPPRPAPAWVLLLLAGVAALLQASAWADARTVVDRRPLRLAELQPVADMLPGRIIALPAHRLDTRASAEGVRHRIPIPEPWMIGNVGDRRAPPSLMVYADGHQVPFERRVTDLERSAPSAWLRGPRTTFVELTMPADAPLAEVALVRHDPLLATTLLLQRTLDSRWSLGAIGVVLAATLTTASVSFRRFRPRLASAAAVALPSCAVFILSGVFEQAWAPVVMATELLALYATARLKEQPATS